MKENSQKLSEQYFKRDNKVTFKPYNRPLAQYPKPFTKLYILAYVATLELEKIEEKKLSALKQISTSSFESVLKR
jgi:hypothetical protein